LFVAAAGTPPSHHQHRHSLAQTRKAAGDAFMISIHKSMHIFLSNRIRYKLTREQIAEAQKLAREWQPMARAQLGGG
ncbi:MAG: hypothetical protein ACJ8D7_06215, partial [Xanthobacteraceae bacterium]